MIFKEYYCLEKEKKKKKKKKKEKEEVYHIKNNQIHVPCSYDYKLVCVD